SQEYFESPQPLRVKYAVETIVFTSENSCESHGLDGRRRVGKGQIFVPPFPSQRLVIRGRLMTSAKKIAVGLLVGTAFSFPVASAQATTAGQRAQATEGVRARAKLVQEMVDSIFSFAEPGFQEVRTSAYITDI